MENSEQIILPSTSRTIYTTRIPRTRGRKRFSLGISSVPVEEEEEPIETLTELLRKTWTIFGVSTLFNFHHDEVHLKQYSKRIREEVATNIAQEDVAYTAKMFVMNDVTVRPSPTDPPPIKITVYAKKYSEEDTTEKCIYTGMLLSWRTASNELVTPNSIRLPLLLCRGSRSSMVIVHNVLSYMFDCLVMALPVQEDDLIWLVPIVITPAIGEEHPKSTGEIRMEYKIPELPDTNAIIMKFQISELLKILTVITRDRSDDVSIEISFNLEHIEKFREILYEQISQTASLQLGLCILRKINLPSFTIMGNKMKVMNAETMNRVLLYLNEKAVDILHTLNLGV
ncbi:PREDICTED: uncharacterized protein LOC107188918 [Dufourea novaeangliae]|uniref:uncharacterized protein LOC107188918 n=1 Tax=Dufourea novaeangliae TaxID=178035 RepID=UPI000767C52B|nr:PREDICTED: uncharacterized protein LOC107188918 [Dufourea novaeangliae]